MTLRSYLFLMSIATLLCWLAWFLVLFSVDPTGSGFLGFLFFYASLFLAIVGSGSVLGFVARRSFLPSDEVVFRHVKQTFRQSILFSGFIFLALILLERRWLSWWSLLILLLLVVAVETIIFTNRKYRNGSYVE